MNREWRVHVYKLREHARIDHTYTSNSIFYVCIDLVGWKGKYRLSFCDTYNDVKKKKIINTVGKQKLKKKKKMFTCYTLYNGVIPRVRTCGNCEVRSLFNVTKQYLLSNDILRTLQYCLFFNRIRFLEWQCSYTCIIIITKTVSATFFWRSPPVKRIVSR
jgi:hypothetical protein